MPAEAPSGRRFRAAREYTVGIEEELMLLDAETLALTPAIESLLPERSDELRLAKRELMQCQAEITTEPCRTATEARDRLGALRHDLQERATEHGVVVAGGGTHPFSRWQDQVITFGERYRRMADELQYPARQIVFFGMHVHVAVGGADKAIQLIEGMVDELPVLLALSAASPFWCGEETGLASCRLVISQSMPRTGIPPIFDSYADFDHALERLRRAGAVADHTHVWWDVRPHPGFGTIELRIMDSQPRLDDTATVAALAQALIRHLGKRYDRGEGFARASRFLAAENRWLAARHGLDATLVPYDGDPEQLRVLALRLLERVADDADALGTGWALEGAASILEEGSSADRQRAVVRSGGTVVDVARLLVAESRVA